MIDAIKGFIRSDDVICYIKKGKLLMLFFNSNQSSPTNIANLIINSTQNSKFSSSLYDTNGMKLNMGIDLKIKKNSLKNIS